MVVCDENYGRDDGGGDDDDDGDTKIFVSAVM